MCAQLDVNAIAMGAKDPALVELERQIQEANEKLNTANLEFSNCQDRLTFSSPVRPLIGEQRDEVKRRAEELSGITEALRMTSQDLHRRAMAARPASLAAIASALEPSRRQAVDDIANARVALYGALKRYNDVMTILAKEGSGDKALPQSIPILEAIAVEVGRAR